MIKKVLNVLLPKGSFGRKLIKKIMVKLHLSSPFVAGYYNTWMQQQLRCLPTREYSKIANGPLISIIVPAYNTPERYLDDLVYSIISQAYENWELILVNASNEPKSKKKIDNCVNKDFRIKVIDVKNGGISVNTNIGIKAASGSYIAFCDHDDTLDVFALYEVALKIVNEDAELIYTDEDKISDDGRLSLDPHYKPDWSPDLLTHVNYINHLTVVSKKLLHKVGLLDPKMDGAQDYDLLLRLVSENPKIVHIPKILYHWRAAHNSTAQDFSSKKNITNAAKKALENYFAKSGIDIKATPKNDQPGFYELMFKDPKKISFIIMPFASNAILKLFIEILLVKTNLNTTKFELIIPSGSEPKDISNEIKIKTIESDYDFLKEAVDVASSDKIIIIDQIALPNKSDWAQRLCGSLSQKHIRVASPLIVQNECNVDDCGLVIDTYGNYSNLFKGCLADNNHTLFGNTDWVRNVDALNGGVAAVRKDQFKLFLEDYKINMHKAVFNFSKQDDLYNTIYAGVVMDSFAIHLNIDKQVKPVMFNSNLIVNGGDFVISTPEASAICILLNIAEKEGLSI